ncbi:MAG: hypothetical protein KF830_15310 [Planctomycetes bacterium]|nr:hypothetical protein [Planctomycetota bacterium]
MKRTSFPILGLLCLAAACDREAKPTGGMPAQPATGPAAMGDHGEEHPLGELTLGAHTFRVVQEGDIQAGKEGAINLVFAKGKALPGTARAWIGVESAQGSMKARLAKEGNDTLHGHVEVPKVIPDGSKVWIEIEENGQKLRGSLAWH